MTQTKSNSESETNVSRIAVSTASGQMAPDANAATRQNARTNGFREADRSRSKYAPVSTYANAAKAPAAHPLYSSPKLGTIAECDAFIRVILTLCEAIPTPTAAMTDAVSTARNTGRLVDHFRKEEFAVTDSVRLTRNRQV